MLNGHEHKEQQGIPTFRIYDKKKQKIGSLLHCFLKPIHFNSDDYLNCKGFTLKSGPRFISYQIVWDDSVFPDLIENRQGLDCIVSFQKHIHGCFAVVKKARK